jgi:hypothetical protein
MVNQTDLLKSHQEEITLENSYQPVTVKVNLQKDDLVNASVVYIKSKMKLGKKQWFFLFITMFMIIILLMVLMIQFSGNNTSRQGTISRADINFFIWSGSLLILLILLRCTAPNIIKKSAAKQFEASDELQKDTCFMFTAEGIRIFSQTQDISLVWDRGFYIIDSNDYFTLCRSNLVTFVIPKRCFENTEDLQTVTEMIHDKMSGKKYIKVEGI